VDEQGRTGKTVAGWHPTEINKSDSDEEKGLQFFTRKQIGVTL